MLGFVGIAVFFLVGLLVSIRLLGLWAQTRRLPELLAGLGLLGIGPLGFCVLMGGITLFSGTRLAHVFGLIGLGVQACGFVASVAFTWRVFHPGAAWARALATGISVVLFAAWASMLLLPTRAGEVYLHHHIDILVKIFCLCWGAFESLRYWRVSQQRVAIGFADPLVTASFLAWGIALSAGALGFVSIYAALLGLEPGEHLGGGIQLLLSGCGIVTAGGLYLAFLPPRAYARRLAARASATAAAVES